MTCIVGIVEDGQVYLAADSAGTAGYTQVVRLDAKVFRNGPFLLASAYSWRAGQVVRYAFHPPEPPGYDQLRLVPGADGVVDDALHRYMVTEFANALRTCLKEAGVAGTQDGREVGSYLLVGYAGRLFHIESDYQVGERSDGFDALGAGAEVALGALYATADLEMAPAKRLGRALAAAARFNTTCAAPFLCDVLPALPAPTPPPPPDEPTREVVIEADGAEDETPLPPPDETLAPRARRQRRVQVTPGQPTRKVAKVARRKQREVA